MTVPPHPNTAVDRKTCSHVVEGWWGHERAALCTPPWSVLRQALLVEHADVAYVVVVGASSGAKRNGTRSPFHECSNTIPIDQLIESLEAASNEEPIVTPPPTPKYKLIIDEETENQPKAEIEAKFMTNEIVENETLPSEDDEENHQFLPMEPSPPTGSTMGGDSLPEEDMVEPDPVQAPHTNEAPPRPRFRLIID
jgi:hypothetical protein